MGFFHMEIMVMTMVDYITFNIRFLPMVIMVIIVVAIVEGFYQTMATMFLSNEILVGNYGFVQ